MDKTEGILFQLLNTRDESMVRSPDWYRRLVDNVSRLINHDFNKLVNLLYRVDVSEEKLRDLLQQKPTDDAATIIANLLLERQLQKLNQFKEFKQNQAQDDDVEKW